jgi:hypothetical protein
MNDPRDASVPTDRAGSRIVGVDLLGTSVFVVSGAVGAAASDARPAAVVVAVLLFAIGVAAFIWSFFSAAERSREFEIGVANLYLLTGATAPPNIRRVMLACLAAQTVGSLTFAWVGFSGLEADEANLLAFGILVPMFGLGLDGLWAARHGAFGPRIVSTTTNRRSGVPPSDHDLEKNAPHG